ncbi:MAG TPA: DUF1178 family protein [Burkholderiales bacterium]|nr:DUF1178 family protein [Burkholderiales bacterium]
MIVYDLLCENAHQFEGWFASPEAFTDQDRAGQLSCPMCGSSSIHKQPSAPYVQTGGNVEGDQSVMADPELLEGMRRKVVEFILQNTEDVGTRFPSEARAIHKKEAPDRAIRGQATRQEAKALRDEGIEVFSLPAPALPKDKLH